MLGDLAGAAGGLAGWDGWAGELAGPARSLTWQAGRGWVAVRAGLGEIAGLDGWSDWMAGWPGGLASWLLG